MKRLFSIFVILLIGTSLFAQHKYLDTLVKDLTIYGYLDEYIILYVEEIQTDSANTIGMPFDITGSDVKYNNSDTRMGRQICFWSFATNMTNVKLSITADPLTSEKNSTYTINYYMTFSYEYSKIDSEGNTSDVIGYLTMHSGQTENHLTNYIGNAISGQDISYLTISNKSGNESMPVISMNKDIRFMFDEDAPSTFSSYPEGFYYSTVTITMEAN